MQRDYGRPIVCSLTFAFGVVELASRIYFLNSGYHEQMEDLLTTYAPNDYTLGELLRLWRALFPVALQVIILFMDNSLDLLPGMQDDPLKIFS